VGADRLERMTHRVKVSRAVVNHGDHRAGAMPSRSDRSDTKLVVGSQSCMS
jgi:hypothetical protein